MQRDDAACGGRGCGGAGRRDGRARRGDGGGEGRGRRGDLRRGGLAGNSGERTVSAGSRARGIQVAVRREEDAGAHPVHLEDRKAAEELAMNATMLNTAGALCVLIGITHSYLGEKK